MESVRITRARIDMTKNVGVYQFFLFSDRLICICCSEQLYRLGSSAWIFFQSVSACIASDDFRSQEWPGRRAQKPSHLDNWLVCICSVLLPSFVVEVFWQNTFFLGLSSVAGERQCSWSGKGCVELSEHRSQLLSWPGGLFSYLQDNATVADFSWCETQLGIQSLFALDTVCAVHLSSSRCFISSQLIYKLLWHHSSKYS